MRMFLGFNFELIVKGQYRICYDDSYESFVVSFFLFFSIFKLFEKGL